MFSNQDNAPIVQQKSYRIDHVTLTIVCNTLEATKFVYFEGLSVEKETPALYKKIIDTIEEEAGKYFLVLPSNIDLSSFIRKNQPDQLAKIANANPLIIDVKNADKFQQLSRQEATCDVYIDESKNANLSKIAQEISTFQIKSLCDIRDDLSDDEAKKKIEDRYQLKMIEKKLKSNRIAICVAKDSKGIAGTLVVTSFPPHLYASDLILRKDLLDNQQFISQLLGQIYHSLATVFKGVNLITLLAPIPPGKPLPKLVKCIASATKKDGSALCENLTAEMQAKIGLLTYFVAPKKALVLDPVSLRAGKI